MINRVVLVGRLTRDPELKYTTNGIANLRFSIAVNRTFTSQNGERQADFINETGSYQAQDGSMRYTTDVVCDSVQFLEPRSATADRGNYGAQPSQDFGGGNPFGGGYAGTPSFPQQAPTPNNFGGGNPFSSTPNVDQSFANPSSSFNNEPDFSSTISISDDDLPF